jgi:hypothetical protein
MFRVIGVFLLVLVLLLAIIVFEGVPSDSPSAQQPVNDSAPAPMSSDEKEMKNFKID